MPRLLKVIGGVIILIAAGYLTIVGVLFVSQRAMLYVAGGQIVRPETVGFPDIVEQTLETPDGERLAVWYHPPKSGEHTFLYLQGNAESFPEREGPFRTIIEGGYGLYAVSYRGFAGSTGKATQDGLITDALAAYDWLTEQGQTVILLGQSLGSGVAVELAVRRNVDAVVLEVPFTAAVDVAAWLYPLLPVRLLMKDQWRSRDIIASITAPVLIVGAELDTVIPVEQSRQLFDFASEPKSYVVLEGSGHTNTWESGIWNEIKPFLSEVLRGG
ncbi:MAG: alpha/beta hydrolase [Pseudomonadota bacterium]